MYLACFFKTVKDSSHRLGVHFGVTAMVMVLMFVVLAPQQADAQTRTLRMYFVNSGESATITFKKNGRYVKSGLRKANRFLRDWRRKEPTRMDPKLLDLVWEVYQKSGSRKPLQVISGYRSPRTNKMLRRRGRGVALNSQHTKGKALDFFMTDVSIKKLRTLGLQAHRGGVGYYKGSFIHLDTGKIRHWPKMSRRQLARVFPRGKTIHVPSNGRPLSGYKVAMANLKKGLNADGRRRGTRPRGTVLASIFRGGSSREDSSTVVTRKRKAPVKKVVPKPKPVVIAKAAPVKKPARAKVRGADPFNLDAGAVSKAEARRLAAEKLKLEQKHRQEEERKEEEAKAILIARAKTKADEEKAEQLALAQVKAEEKADKKAAQDLARRTKEEALIASLAPAAQVRVATPQLRPQLRPTTTQLALAPENTRRSAISKLLRATELVVATPPGVSLSSPAQALRPVVDIPVHELSIPRDAKKLSARTLALLAKQKKLYSPEKVIRLQKKVKTELAPVNVPLPKLSPARPKSAPKPVLEAALQPQTRVTRPSLQKEKVVAPTATQVPLPNSNVNSETTLALETGGFVQVQNELKLGNLDGRDVKKWAVAISTRIGPSAILQAPVYEQNTQRAAPTSVFSAGFAFARLPLRADRFSGRALTRVAFARFGHRN